MASIKPFIHRKIVVLHEDAPSHEAAHAMCERAIGCVVVSDHKGHLTGIVTDRDLTCALVADSGSRDRPIAQVMTTPVVTVEESADLEAVIRLMVIYGIRRIPVVHYSSGETQKCIGMVTLDDLIASRSIDEYRLIRIVKSQIRRRIRQYQQKPVMIHFSEHPEPKAADQVSTEEFYHEVALHAGLLKDERSLPQFQEIIKMILESLVRRLHYTGAMHLVNQLPVPLQDELRELPAGPDRSITLPSILLELQTRFGMASDRAHKVMTGICNALEQTLDYEQLRHVKAQLPEDLRDTFEVER